MFPMGVTFGGHAIFGEGASVSFAESVVLQKDATLSYLSRNERLIIGRGTCLGPPIDTQ